jgi:WD40 repeat protein
LAPSFSFDLPHNDALSAISQFNLAALDLVSEQINSTSTYFIQHALRHAIESVQDCVSYRIYRSHPHAGTAMIQMLILASSFAYFELRVRTCRRGAFALVSELNTVESLCSSCLKAAETIDQDSDYYSQPNPLKPLVLDLVVSFRNLTAFVQETHQNWAGGDELLCRPTNIWLCAHVRPKTSFEYLQSVASVARWQTRPIPWLELISINMIESDDAEFMQQVLQINQSDTDQYSMLRVCAPASHLDRHGCTSIHPSGRIMASTSFDRHVVLIWDVLLGVCVQELVGHTAPLSSVAFSSDGKLLCSGSQDGTARIWSTDSGECICVVDPRSGPITCVLLIDKPVNSTAMLDSYLLATGGTDGCTRIFEPASQRQFNMLLSHHSFQHQNGGVSAMVLHPTDQKLLMIGYNEGAARLWYYHSSACRLLDGFDRVVSLMFTDDGSKALIYIENGQLCVWRVADAICEQVIALKSAKSVSISAAPPLVTSPPKQRPKTPLRSPSKPLKSNLKTVTSPAAVLQALPVKVSNSDQFRDSLAHWWACNLRF